MNLSMQELQEILKKNPAVRVNPRYVKYLEGMDGKPEAKENKYHAKKTEIDGRVFDSEAEASRYCELKILQAAGIIKSFECQPVYQVAAKTKYIPDFRIEYHDGHIEVEDVKGFFTSTSRLKVKLFKEKYPDIVFKLIKNGEEKKC